MRRDAHSDRRRVHHYVSAVLGMAGDGGDWEAWEEEMLALHRVASDAAVRALFVRSTASVDVRLGDFDNLTEGIIGERGRSIGHLLIQDGIFDLLPVIWAQFVRRSETEGPIDRVTVRSAVPMSPDDVGNLREQMQRPERRMIFRNELDPTIKGGFVLRYGDWRRDFSVAAKLDALRQALC